MRLSTAFAIFLCAATALLPASHAAADPGYEQARLDYFSLRSDPARNTLRHHWMDVIGRLDRGVSKMGKGERLCAALFNAGRAWHEMSNVSYLWSDREEAMRRYGRLVEACPSSNLADDALFHTAELQQRRDPTAAKRTWERQLSAYPRGDKAQDARERLRDLPPPTESERLAAAEKAAAAKRAEDAAARKREADRVAAAEKAAAAKRAEETAARTREADRVAAAEKAAAAKRAEETAARTREADRVAAADKAAAAKRAEEAAARTRDADRVAAAEKAAASPRAEETADRTRDAARVAAVGRSDPRTELAQGTPAGPDDPGSALPSAADILAALDARGADAARPEDVALAEDLRRDAMVVVQTPSHKGEGSPPTGGLDRSQLARIEASTGGDIPLSLAAGLKVRRVVIDPGHGGKDTGAIGKKGTREKDLTLEISRKLRKRLLAMGLEVHMTRDSDVFLELEERTRFANEKRADLFISVHVNAATNRNAKGIETYTLNLNSDRYAMRLAARENASSTKSIGELQFILADLATKANTDDSVRLARLVQGEMVGRLRKKWGKDIRDLGVKQALFFVLVGARMPAILVEASFVSNADEEQRLRTPAYQDETAAAIAEGVRRFIDDREAIARGGDGGSNGVF